MTEQDELLDEIDKLKKDLVNQHMMLQMLLGGGSITNKRIDVLEALAMSTSTLAQTVARTLENHLEALRSLPDPVKTEQKNKKETHPEFA